MIIHVHKNTRDYWKIVWIWWREIIDAWLSNGYKIKWTLRTCENQLKDYIFSVRFFFQHIFNVFFPFFIVKSSKNLKFNEIPHSINYFNGFLSAHTEQLFDSIYCIMTLKMAIGKVWMKDRKIVGISRSHLCQPQVLCSTSPNHICI